MAISSFESTTQLEQYCQQTSSKSDQLEACRSVLCHKELVEKQLRSLVFAACEWVAAHNLTRYEGLRTGQVLRQLDEDFQIKPITEAKSCEEQSKTRDSSVLAR